MTLHYTVCYHDTGVLIAKLEMFNKTPRFHYNSCNKTNYFASTDPHLEDYLGKDSGGSSGGNSGRDTPY